MTHAEKSIECQLINFFKSKVGIIQVENLLDYLDLSVLSDSIKYRSIKHQKETFLKIYLYKRIKGIKNYPDLIESLTDTKFSVAPSKRTFNEFFKHKCDRILLDKIAELILKTATKNKIILDINLVRKAIQKKRKEINRYQKEIREAVNLVKKLVYPQIDLKIRQNAKFTTRDLLDVLVHVAHTNSFANDGAKTFKELNPKKTIPSGDTLLYHFSKLDDVDELKDIFERIFDVILGFAKKEYNVLTKRKIDIAYDIHKIPFYGRSMNYIMSGKSEKGTDRFFNFLTCAIVVAGKRFTVDAIPIHAFDTIENLLDESLKRVKQKIHIDKVYLDRGFDRVAVINVLKSNNVKFIIPKVRSATVKSWFDKCEGISSRVIKEFKIGKGKKKAFVNLVLIDDLDGIKRAFITNIDISAPMAHYLFRFYSKRWGIETSYRSIEIDFKPRTTSTNYCIRLFYFLFSVILYNLWVLVNLCVSISIYGKVPQKPLISAKMFTIILYKVGYG